MRRDGGWKRQHIYHRHDTLKPDLLATGK
ncbi:hypothetical protein A2U01_0081162, partial [Trifolium medium]|nr:hypothetical protein [Trifolium medium]